MKLSTAYLITDTEEPYMTRVIQQQFSDNPVQIRKILKTASNHSPAVMQAWFDVNVVWWSMLYLSSLAVLRIYSSSCD